MPNKYWKKIESDAAKIFGGKRVPLSGMNSRHGTSADVMGVPDDIYVEVKRDKRYYAAVEPLSDLLTKDCPWIKLILGQHWVYCIRLCNRVLPDGLPAGPFSKLCLRGIKCFGFKGRTANALLRLWEDSVAKATKENRDNVYLMIKFYERNHRGFACITDFGGLKRLYGYVPAETT